MCTISLLLSLLLSALSMLDALQSSFHVLQVLQASFDSVLKCRECADT